MGEQYVLSPNFYFSEHQASYVATCKKSDLRAIEDKSFGICDAFQIGETGGNSVVWMSLGDDSLVKSSVSLTALREASDSFFRDWMEG